MSVIVRVKEGVGSLASRLKVTTEGGQEITDINDFEMAYGPDGKMYARLQVEISDKSFAPAAPYQMRPIGD